MPLMLVPNYNWNFTRNTFHGPVCLVTNEHLRSLCNKAFVLSQEYFYLQAEFSPNILVKNSLDYDKVQKISMTLYAQVSWFEV